MFKIMLLYKQLFVHPVAIKNIFELKCKIYETGNPELQLLGVVTRNTCVSKKNDKWTWNVKQLTNYKLFAAVRKRKTERGWAGSENQMINVTTAPLAADEISQANWITDYVKIALDIKFLGELKRKLRFWRKSNTILREVVKKSRTGRWISVIELTPSVRQLLKICELTN